MHNKCITTTRIAKKSLSYQSSRCLLSYSSTKEVSYTCLRLNMHSTTKKYSFLDLHPDTSTVL